MIFDKLTWKINLVLKTIRIKALADPVWTLVKNIGFGAIEKIINFFDDEERQEDLATIILDADYFKQQLNYNGSGTLNYVAVAKAAILYFANYIHETLIKGQGWVEDTWNWLIGSGKTLVDLVNTIFNVASTAISAIKNAVTTVLNAVKAGLEYQSNPITGTIRKNYLM